MKRLAAISTLLASLALPILSVSILSIPVRAQHGGGHVGGGFSGHGGGFSGHGGGSGFSGGSRSGPAPRSGSHPSFARPESQPGFRSGSLPRYQFRPGIAPRSFAGPGMQTTTVSPYRQAYRSPNDPENRRWNHGGVVYENHRDHRPRYGSGYRNGYQYGYIAPYFGGYPYGLGFYGGDGYYDDSLNYSSDQTDDSGQSYNQDNDQDPYYGPGQYNGFDPQGSYPAPQGYQVEYEDQGQFRDQDQAQVQGPEPGQNPNEIPPGAPYQPNYGPQDSPSGPQRNLNSRSAARPAYRSAQSSANRAVPNQPAVTLVFKDKRPNQVIHNYLINGSTLTVWDQSAHDIPVEELNVEATRKINRDQGVDFFLPSSSR